MKELESDQLCGFLLFLVHHKGVFLLVPCFRKDRLVLQFNQCDTDQDGRISFREFRNLLVSQGYVLLWEFPNLLVSQGYLVLWEFRDLLVSQG